MNHRPLRTELYLIAHDADRADYRPFVNLPTLGAALVGAEVIDLLLAGQLSVVDHRLVPRPGTGDRTAHRILDTVRAAATAAPPGPAITDLIELHRRDSYQQTTDDLVRAGVLTPTRDWLKRHRHRPTDPLVHAPRARGGPRHAVRHPESVDLPTAALCALIRTTGLEPALFLSLTTTEVRTQLDRIVERLATHPSDPYRRAVPDIVHAVDLVINDLAVAVYR